MSVTIQIPTPLRKLTSDQASVEVEPGTVSSAFTQLESRFPGIQERLLDAQGQVRGFVLVYVNDEDIRFLQNKETPLKSGDVVNIQPAIAGG
jgi:molybdopterin synthase sulfur carrier subunit